MADDVATVVFKKKRKGGGRATLRRTDSAEPSPSPAPLSADEGDDGTSSNVDELLALRAMRQTQRKMGIDVDKLHAGDERERKRAKLLHEEDPHPQHGLRQMGSSNRVEAEDPPNSAKSIIKTNQFTGQTNALDVDKHMMAYIEEELAKRQGVGTAKIDAKAELAKLDPDDELFRVVEQSMIEKKVAQEGNITLSSAMLTAIPEVDLGIEARLKNIEATERAKRALFEATQAAKSHKPPEDGGWAAGRFFLPENRKQEVADIMALARAEAERGDRTDEVPQVSIPHQSPEGRRQLSTDQKVMQRFKQREADRKKR